MLYPLVATRLSSSGLEGARSPGKAAGGLNARRSGLTTLVILISAGLLACGTNDALSGDPEEQGAGYARERVTYSNGDILLSGILWLPQTPGPHPALVLVDGSGETTAERLKSWAEHYSRSGIACLSYDKRGVGQSGGAYLGGLDIDIPLLASDVTAGVEYLKSRKEIDRSQIGLAGQSQAGWVIPVAAADSKDVSFTIILSGATVTLGEEDYYSQLSGDDPFWKYIYRNLSRDEISRRLAAKGPSLFDPLPYLRKMTVPGLWLYGELDTSQPTRESIAILEGLVRDHDKDFTYEVFEGADHGLAVDGKLAEGGLETLDGWLLDHVTVRDR